MFKGEGGGVPWVQIMENELECLGDRKGHDGRLAKKFLKKYFSRRELSRLPCRNLAVSAFISKWSF